MSSAVLSFGQRAADAASATPGAGGTRATTDCVMHKVRQLRQGELVLARQFHGACEETFAVVACQLAACQDHVVGGGLLAPLRTAIGGVCGAHHVNVFPFGTARRVPRTHLKWPATRYLSCDALPFLLVTRNPHQMTYKDSASQPSGPTLNTHSRYCTVFSLSPCFASLHPCQ